MDLLDLPLLLYHTAELRCARVAAKAAPTVTAVYGARAADLLDCGLTDLEGGAVHGFGRSKEWEREEKEGVHRYSPEAGVEPVSEESISTKGI